MADIEELAGKWADQYMEEDHGDNSFREDLITAYLAGSAQTQADYVKHYAVP